MQGRIDMIDKTKDRHRISWTSGPHGPVGVVQCLARRRFGAEAECHRTESAGAEKRGPSECEFAAAADIAEASGISIDTLYAGGEVDGLRDGYVEFWQDDYGLAWKYSMSMNEERAAEFIARQGGVVPSWAQVLCVVEEAGEFAEAFRDALPGVAEELADVVIASYTVAAGLGLDHGVEALHRRTRRVRGDQAEEFIPQPWARVLSVAGKAGEFAGAFRRWSGHARRPGSLAEVAAKLADVVNASYAAAVSIGCDLDAEVARKWIIVAGRPAVHGSDA
jgi:NTP pyrophosphatase (non-canonical NTP hydrolase)